MSYKVTVELLELSIDRLNKVTNSPLKPYLSGFELGANHERS